MAFLNKEERQALVDSLKDMTFNKAKWRLRRLDPKGRMALYRNAQTSGDLYTRFDLYGLGTTVTLVERHVGEESPTELPGPTATRIKSVITLVEIIVAPMPDNRT